MPGSTFSIAGINTILNTTVAEELRQFADELEGCENLAKAVNEIVRRTMREHKQIIFNGNNYSEEWVTEANARGLLNLRSTADALPLLTAEKNVKLFARHKVFTKEEISSRQEIYTENYCKILRIETLTMVDMMKRGILPAVSAYLKDLAVTSEALKKAGLEINTSLMEKLNALYNAGTKKLASLEIAMQEAFSFGNGERGASCYRDRVIPEMKGLRAIADEMELSTAKEYWPYPSYGDILFSVC